MLERWASTVVRRRWWVLAIAVVLAVLAGTASSTLTDRLQQGGYDVPGSESTRATSTIERAVGQQDADAVAVYRSKGSLDDSAVIADVRTQIDALPSSSVDRVVGWWQQPALISPDGHTAAVAIHLKADEQGAQVEAWRVLEPRLADAPDGASVKFTGLAPLGSALTQQTEQDLVKAEAISFPILLVLLILVFGGLIAAGMPLVVGGVGIVGALGVLWLLTTVTDVSVFAMNVVTLLGLGLAIDYGLFIVSRFREELDGGASVRDALTTTLKTSGRTVLISALTVAAALSGLLVFPQMMLRSVGIGGIAAVVVAAVAALTVLPALLAILGRRISSLSLPFGRRRRGVPREDKGWGRIGRLVMKRPALVAVAVVAGLLALGTPFLHAEYGDADASMLPRENSVRVATEQVREHLPGASSESASVVVVGDDGAAPTRSAVQSVTRELGSIDGIGRVTPTASGKDVTVLSAAFSNGDPVSAESQSLLRELRSVPVPDGASDVLVGGQTANLVDMLDGIGDRIPWMLLVLAGAVLVLLFLAFGSLVLPLKAIVLSALSLTASFGALVWIFQDGHLVSWLGAEAGPIEASTPVLMLAILFGLSTDYELFLLSRIAEGYKSGRSPREAVLYGLSRTGGLITAAALLLGVVIGAFALGDVKFMKLIGVGMLIAIAVDATIVRGLLVPSLLALLGRAAWWAPRPLARLADRFSLEPPEPAVKTDAQGNAVSANGETEPSANGRAESPAPEPVRGRPR